jgi:hypothetical protein
MPIPGEVWVPFLRAVGNVDAARTAKFKVQQRMESARVNLHVAMRRLVEACPDAANHPVVEHWRNNIEYLK